MANTKEYKIVINGLTESINAVESLNKQLDKLEQKIKVLNSTKAVAGGTATTKTSKSTLSEEEKLAKKIEQIDAQRVAYSKKIYQSYLAAKDVLKETLNDQKQIAAEERLQADSYRNTMQDLKQKLADIKVVMQTTEIGSDVFQRYTKEANELTNKLKELEQAYGQFGRNVGNYASAADGFNKIKVAVGDTVREYDNYRQAIKELRQERFQLSQSVGQEADEYKKVDTALKTLESDYQDLAKSSSVMDNILDTMQGFTALASIGVGFNTLFGINDSTFQETMQKLTALLVIMKSIEALMLQIQTRQGYVAKGFMYIGEVSNKVFGALFSALLKVEGAVLKVAVGTQRAGRIMRTSMDAVLKILNALRVTFATLLTGGILLFLPELLTFFSDFIKSLNSSKIAADNAASAIKALNQQLKIRNDLLAASYLKGEISDEKYLEQIYNNQAEALAKQIEYLKIRASELQANNFSNGFGLFKKEKNTEFTGKALTGETEIRNGRLIDPNGMGFGITVKNIQEVEKAWKQCNEALKEGKDYFDKWGTGLSGWLNSLLTTTKDTEVVMRGLGNTMLSNFVASFETANKQFKDGKISAEQYAAELNKLQKQMNSSEVLNSVIANLDKYIPDDEVREAVQSIINEIIRLDDAFNMTSEAQIHYWNQVRIDAMKDGLKKELAQIQENERHEITEVGKTQEQINLIHAKYQRQRLNAQEKANKEAANKAKEANKKQIAAENELIALRIENMKDGLDKRLAELENERRLELQKVKENGIKVGELSLEINKKYDQKILDEKRKWAFDVLKIYQDLAARIENINRRTFEIETSTASQKVANRESSKKEDLGYALINENSYDNLNKMDDYYKRLIGIEREAADEEAQIQQERLDRELEFNKKEEELRYERLMNLDNGEYIQRLRAGQITQEQYDELIEKEKQAHNARMKALDQQYVTESNKLIEDGLKKTHQIYSNYFDKIINTVKEKKAQIDQAAMNSTATDKTGFGIVNIKQTYKNIDQALKGYEDLKNETIKKQQELDQALKDKKISAEDFAVKKKDLDDTLKGIDQSVKETVEKQKDVWGEFVASIQKYVNAIGQGIQQTMQAVWDYQDYMMDKEQDELDKWNDKLDEQLSKQENIIEQHKNSVDSIEDELATARGDRRQHLIDQLNAEISAERAAQKEKQRIEKEQEQAKKKQEALDKKRREQEYKRNVAQAFIAWHLSIANGLATQPFLPVGIAMGALATALGAVQYALVKSQKPYAKGGQLDGGVAQGARHRDGGIPVLGGRASIEGGEFITNRRTTAENVDLLEFVNSKHRKLSIDDFIDFYSTTPRKVIRGVRTKFEDGGYLPTLPSTLDVKDQLQNIVINQDNRPVVVSVVDINNKQEDVRRVQTLAGL